MKPIALGPRSLVVDGRDVPLFAGAMHYHRVPPRNWGACLKSLRGLGFTIVDTVAPWNVHETGPGRFDFQGQRDLGAFLDACAAEGLLALVRVGPRAGGELLYGGLPARIAADPAIAARTAAGNPAAAIDIPRAFAAPSYASRRFLDEVRTFYRALAEVLVPRLHPRGPVALLSLDHELGGCYRAGPFCGDYHPEALAIWNLEEPGLAPPRRFANIQDAGDLVPHLRWLAFRERQTNAALTALSALLDEVGLSSVRRLHGFPPLPPVVYDVAAAERVVDAAAIHFLGGRADYARTRRHARYLAGSSRLPLAAPLAIGNFPWGPPLSNDGVGDGIGAGVRDGVGDGVRDGVGAGVRDGVRAVDGRDGGRDGDGDRDAIFSLLAALMHGAAGWSAHMAVGRDRWIGAPIDETGAVRPALGEPLARLHAGLIAAGWTGLHRAAPIGLLLPRAYARLALASSHLGPLAPLGEFLRLDEAAARDDRFGFAGPVQIEQRIWRDALEAALTTAALPFVILDDSASDERLASLRLLVVPTFDFLDAGLAARLSRFAQAGGTLLSGPRVPSRDAAMQQADFALPGLRLEAALRGDPAALAARLRAEAASIGLSPETPAEAVPAPVETALYRRADGTPALLFLANPSHAPAAVPRSALATISPAGTTVLRDLLDPLDPEGHAETDPPAGPIALAPRSIRVFSLATRGFSVAEPHPVETP